MRVTPVTKEDADKGGGVEPFRAGDYDFIIHMAEERLSKAGNEMLALTLHVFNRDNEKRTVFDYILSTESAQWKARHLMESIGLAKRYDQGIIEPREIEGKPGRCKLRFEQAGDYPAKNSVVDYLGAKPADVAISYGPASTASRPRQPEPAQAAGGRIIEDDIPF